MERHTTDHHHEKSQLNRLVGGLLTLAPIIVALLTSYPAIICTHHNSTPTCHLIATVIVVKLQSMGKTAFQQPVNSQSTMKLSQKLVVFFDPTHLLVAYTEQSQCYIVVMLVGRLMNKAGGLGMRLILMVEPILLFFIGCFKKPYQFGLFRCSRL